MSACPSQQSTPPFMLEARVLCVCTLIWTSFIWGCSLMPGSVSSAQSDTVVTHLDMLWNLFHISDVHTMIMLVRKSAHVLEYMLLGCLFFSYIYFRTYESTSSFADTMRKLLVPSMLSGALIAAIDEIIQTQVIGRCGSVYDVGIDSIGILIGSLMGARATQAYSCWRRKRINHEA